MHIASYYIDNIMIPVAEEGHNFWGAQFKAKIEAV